MVQLSDVGPERMRRMDAAGIDPQILSHIRPGVQTLDCDTAIPLWPKHSRGGQFVPPSAFVQNGELHRPGDKPPVEIRQPPHRTLQIITFPTRTIVP